MKQYKRWIALALSLFGVLGCLAGCGAGDSTITQATPGTDAGQTESAPNGGETTAAAMGRYVEQTVQLPECSYPIDMVMLSTGQLRVAVKDNNYEALICTAGETPGQWQSVENLPEGITASGSVESLALSADGSIFCSTVQEMEDGTYQYHFWIADPAGTCREIPITYPDLDNTAGLLVSSCDFTASGRLFVDLNIRDVREINLETGELSENLNDAGVSTMALECAGENLYLLGWGGAYVWNEDNGLQPLSGVLEEQVAASLKATEGYSPKVTFWENSQGYLMFTTHEGLYSYVPDGSVTEELVSGTGTSLADPVFFPTAMTGGTDDSFYVLGRQNGQPALYHYVYDPNVPTEPSTHLTVYSLYPQETLMQLISQYQKAHPETAVTLEVGLTGEDGVTESDAIRTLNTQILAGDGPDLICLDGFNLNTYQEKGLLADLTQILDQGEKTLEQVTKCYADEGKVYMVPTAFAIPVVYGPGEIVSQIQDLDSLVTAAGMAKDANPESNTVFSGFIPTYLADKFYDCCSASWFREDGTLDGQKLEQFYAAMQELYAMDSEFRQNLQQMMESEGRSLEDVEYTPGEYTGLGGVITIFSTNSCLDAGTLESMDNWSYALAGDESFEAYQVLPLNAQASNVFLPRRVMGILTSSTQQEAAAQFLSFLLSEEAQSSAQGFGFPVNQAAFDRQITQDRTLDTSLAMSDEEGNMLTFYLRYPDAELRQQFKTWVDQLTTPASTDRIIRSMVVEQAAACLNGELTPQQASDAALQALNLYLTE